MWPGVLNDDTLFHFIHCVKHAVVVVHPKLEHASFALAAKEVCAFLFLNTISYAAIGALHHDVFATIMGRSQDSQ